MRVRTVALSVGAVVALFLGVLATREPAATRSVRSRLVGRPAPAIEGPTLAGDAFRLDTLRGRWVIVNFFATWCEPCRDEHDDLQELAATHAAAGDAAVVSVIYDPDDADDVREFFAERGGDWAVVRDDGAKLDYGVRGVPESFVVDPSGSVTAHLVGGVRARDVELLLRVQP